MSYPLDFLLSIRGTTVHHIGAITATIVTTATTTGPGSKHILVMMRESRLREIVHNIRLSIDGC